MNETGSIKLILSNIETSFLWTIENFNDKIVAKNGHYSFSPPVIDSDLNDNSKWYFSLYPFKNNSGFDSRYVGMFIFFHQEHISPNGNNDDKSQKSFQISFEISVLNRNGTAFNSLKKNCIFTTVLEDIFVPDDKFKQGTCYIVDSIPKFVLKSDIKNIISINGDLNIKFKITFKRHPINLVQKTNNSREFEAVLNNELFSDMKINVNNLSFPVHKVILAAKSPVFMSLFESDKENKTQNVTINDIEEIAVKEMLRFMYIGEVENIEDIALDLLDAAVRYRIDSLKEVCENELINQLTVDNSIDYLIQAESFHAQVLKSEAIKLIVENIEDLMNSEDWKKLNFSLLTDIIRPCKIQYQNLK